MRQNGIYLVIATTLLLLGSLQPAQSACSSSENGLRFCADISCFRGAEHNTYVEIYYRMNNDQLTFQPIENYPDIPETAKETHEFAAAFEVTIQLFSLKGDTIVADVRRQTVLSQTQEDTYSDQLFALDQRALVMQPGEYKLLIQMQDENSHRKGFLLLPVVAESFPPDQLSLSDIQLSTYIQQYQPDYGNPKFAKNGLEITPNPAQTFGNQFPNLYLYYEVYNLKPGENAFFEEAIDILDDNGNTVKSIEPATVEVTTETRVRVQRILVGSLPDGAYTARVQVSQGDQQCTQEKPFTVQSIKPKLPPYPEKIPLADFNTEQLDNLFMGLDYLATNAEKRRIDQLRKEGTDAEKREFLLEFWKERGPEAQKEHYRRVEVANTSYSEHFGFREGWKTEMGRVYITYGPPEEISRYPMTFEVPAYEIWRYYSTGKYLVLMDVDGTGSYIVAGSNIPGEPWDPDWVGYKDYLIQGGNLPTVDQHNLEEEE
ncbi:MAG: GWxTD domain-containing protein [Gemmatimonadetes bacterium]|nr:MAG: GWxTD domain-containing protein [Gemmatimonadota bacterium]